MAINLLSNGSSKMHETSGIGRLGGGGGGRGGGGGGVVRVRAQQLRRSGSMSSEAQISLRGFVESFKL